MAEDARRPAEDDRRLAEDARQSAVPGSPAADSPITSDPTQERSRYLHRTDPPGVPRSAAAGDAEKEPSAFPGVDSPGVSSFATGEHIAPRWQAAVAWALLGEELDLPEGALPRPEALVTELAARGWTAGRIRAHARGETDAERPWPYPIPARLREGCGAAQLFAALGETRRLLGLQVLDTRPPSTRTALNADELRLLREVPPHHGS